jgi:type II secretory pathway pseudopilin PulG
LAVTISTRVREESGFGLVELLIAMTVMVVGITAIVAGMSSGMVALQRAEQSSTAATLADRQMETYRAIRYSNIALKKALVDAAAADSPHSGDVALIGDALNGNFDLTDTLLGTSACSSTPTPVACMPLQSPVTGPDGRSYRIDSYVVWTCAVGDLSTASPNSPAVPGCTGAGSARPSKRVTVVVRDPASPMKTLFRETSTFDQATG